MKKLVIISLLFFFSIITKGQEIKSYNLDISIDVKLKQIDVKGTINIDFEKQNSVLLAFWKNSTIHEISSNQNSVRYTFDTLSPSPITFIRNGKRLTLKKPENGDDIQTIYFSYECDLSDVFGFGKSFMEEWIEIGYYTAWYPVHYDSRRFTSQINISIDKDYKVSGSGIVVKKDSVWEMKHTWPVFDNVIIASKDIKTRKIQEGNLFIETVYTSFPETDIDSVLFGCKDVLNFYQKIYGLKDSAYLKFVLSPMAGRGGYGRDNYISLKASEFNLYVKKGIAHEMAHFWWYNADTDAWDDWLNEAFAEFSMLLYLREKVSKKIYDELIVEYKKLIENSLPIWEIDRASPEAYVALYNKGSLILIEFEQALGKERFYDFLFTILNEKVKNTYDFLDLVEKNISKEMRLWFENKLKT